MLNKNKTTGLILTLLTVTHCSFACLISCIVLIIIIYHLCLNRLNRDDRVIILHCANLYGSLLIYAIILIIMHIQTTLGDLYEQNFDSQRCIYLGYLAIIFISVLYMAFVTQAFYRLCRVVYQQYRWPQHFWLHVILPFIQLIVSLIVLSPLFAWHVVIYIPEEHYCYVLFTNFRGALWGAFIVYGIPILLIMIIYVRITVFIRADGNNQTLVVKRRQQRDLIASRRILITVGLLTFLGAPASILLTRHIITGEIHPLTFRISFFAVSISIAGLNVALSVSISQLRKIIVQSVCCTTGDAH